MDGSNGCNHASVVWVTATVAWCVDCGAIRTTQRLDGIVEPAKWHEPRGLTLPGWKCGACGAFNGTAKEPLIECRACGARR